MSDEKQTADSEKVQCEVCMKEVPASEAKNEEATDYVAHFCGLNCYEKWKEQGLKRKQ